MEFMNTQKALSLIIFVLIAVALLAGGILVCQCCGANEKKAKTPEENTLTPEEEIPATKKFNESYNTIWRTYRNGKYGFKFKYPSTFLISNKESELIILPYKQIIRVDPPEPFHEATKIKKGVINIAVCSGNLDECFMLIPERWELRSPPDVEKITEVSFYRLYLEEKADTALFRITYRTIHQNLLYEINLYIPEDPKIVREEWDNIKYVVNKHAEDKLLTRFIEILSTFTFLFEEKVTEKISGWEIFKDVKRRLEFKYPPDFQICTGQEIDTCNFGFRCDYRPPVETLQVVDRIAKLKIPKYAFLPFSFKDLNVSSNRCGTMYVDLVRKQLCDSLDEADKRETKIQEKTFCYYGPYRSDSDCDMQGCNWTPIYYIPLKNTCYRLSVNFFGSSGLYKSGPPFGLSELPADQERFENLFKLILSTFRTLE